MLSAWLWPKGRGLYYPCREEIMYHIKKLQELSGVSVKTLHYYDKIGLLVLWIWKWLSDIQSEDLERLQVILYYKYLGFSLDQIAELLAEEKSTYCPIWPNSWTIWLKKRQRLDTWFLPCKNFKQKEKRKMTIEKNLLDLATKILKNTSKRRENAVRSHGSSAWTSKRSRRGRQEPLIQFFKSWQILRLFASNSIGKPRSRSEVIWIFP